MNPIEYMLNEICGPGIIQSIFETLSINWFADDNAVLKVVNTIHDTAVKPVAIFLVMIYFMGAIVDKLSNESFTWEQLWRQLAMLIVSMYLIEYGIDIMKWFFGIGMKLTADISTSYKEMGANAIDAAALVNSFKEQWGMDGWLAGFFINIILFIILLIPFLLSWIMRLLVSVICYSRVIEIYARATFAPIALSDFFHSGLQGTGWRYLKNFLAVCLQGAMILAIGIIFSKLYEVISFDAASNVFAFIGKYLAFYASAIMLMFKSLPLTKELVGTA